MYMSSPVCLPRCPPSCRKDAAGRIALPGADLCASAGPDPMPPCKLASITRDLRQPLLALGTLRSLLAGLAAGERSPALVARVDETMTALTAALEALAIAPSLAVQDAPPAAGGWYDMPDPRQALATLTPRQFEIMARVLEGHPSKIIAADLGISRRTVENHRAAIMRKTGTSSLPALARLALAAAFTGAEHP